MSARRAVAGAAIYLLTAVSLTVPVAAAPVSAGVAMVLPADADVRVQVIGKNAAFTHDLWLELPERKPLISAARPPLAADVGRYTAGTELIFALFVRNRGTTHLSTGNFARVTAESPTSWRIGWEDLGDFDYDDLIVRVSWTEVRTPIIFIPGFGGSVMRATQAGRFELDNGHGGDVSVDLSSGDEVWPNLQKALTSDGDDYFDVLRYERDGSAALVPGIAPDGELVTIAGLPIRGTYHAVQGFFERNGYRRGTDLYFFTYDWRRSVEGHVTALDAVVREVMATSGAPSVAIVAHSLGALVARSFLVSGAEREHVRIAVLLGGPQLGTPEGTYALTHGVCIPGSPCIIDRREVKDVITTLPAGAQVAVAPSYYDVFNGADGPHPLAYVDERITAGAPKAPTYDLIRAAMIEQGTASRNIDQAESFHSSDLAWLDAVPGAVWLVAGTGVPTLGQIREHTRLKFVEHQGGSSYAVEDAVDLVYVDGDGTVVRQSAALFDGAVGFDARGSARALLVPLDHGQLVEEPGLKVALDLVRRQPRDSSPVAAIEAVTVSVHSPAELVVADDLGRRLGSADGNVFTSEIPKGTYDRVAETKSLTVPMAGSYRVELTGTAPGAALVLIRWVSDDVVERSMLFRDVPTAPGSSATLSFDADARMASALELDLDGDGEPDRSIAGSILEGPAAADRTAPGITLTSPRPGVLVVGRVPLDWIAHDQESGIHRSVAVVDDSVTLTSPGEIDVVPGAHRIRVLAEDGAGNASVLERSVLAVEGAWLAPIRVEAPGGIDERAGGNVVVARFAVRDASGAFVIDDSVRLEVLDAAGQRVLGPLFRSRLPSTGIAIEGDAYQANVRIDPLPPGEYVLRASFDSERLVGSISATVRRK